MHSSEKKIGFTNLLAACVVVVLGTAPALGSARFWTNPAGGNWSDPTNWGGVAPGPSDECLIMLDGDYTVTLDVNVTVISLVLGGGSGTQTLVVPTGRTFTLNGPTASSVGTHGVFEHQSAVANALSINAAFTNSGLFVVRVNNAIVDVNGSFTNAAGGTLRVQSGPTAARTLTIDGNVTNDGTVELTSNAVFSSTLRLDNGTLTNSSSGVVNALVGAGGSRLLTTAIDNQGIVNIATTTTISHTDAIHSNSGTISINAGTTSISFFEGPVPGPSTFTNTGTISVPTGTTLVVQNLSLGGSPSVFNYDAGLLSGGGEVEFSAMAANLGQDLSNDFAELRLENTVLNGPGTLRNHTRLTMLGINNLFINADVVNASGALLVANNTRTFMNGSFSNAAGATVLSQQPNSGSFALTVANGFTNHGTIELGDAAMTVTTAGFKVSAGTLVNASDGVIWIRPGPGTSRQLLATIDNQGLIDIDRDARWDPLSGSNNNSNTGQIDVSGGTLSIGFSNNVLTNSGAITIAPGATILSVPNFATTGTITLAGGSITGGGTLDLNTLTLLNVNVAHTNTLAELRLRNCGNISGLATLTNETLITQTNGNMNAPVVNDTGGRFVFHGASPRVNGAFDNRAGAVTSVEGGSGFGNAALVVANGGTFTNDGTLEMVNASALAGNVTLTVTTGSLVNQTDGVISFPTGTTGTRTLAAQLDNRGLVDIEYPVTITRASADHVNASTGEIDIVGGDLVVTQSGTTPTFDNAGTIAISAGRILDVNGGTLTNSGSGLITGDGTVDTAGTTFSNAAIVRPGLPIGIETFTGPYPQAAAGRLEIEIGGTTPGTQHDRLDVTATATLAGTLQVSFVNGFVPSPGQTFTVLTAATRTGAFATVDVIGYPDCILETIYSATDVQVRVEQIPPTPVCRNITVDLDGTGNASITAAQVDNGSTDNCQIASLGVAPSTFDCSDLGANTVTLTVTDVAGNVATCNATVTVRDVTPPSIGPCPANEVAECTSAAGAVVTYSSPSATDPCDANPTVTCVPASGSVFGFGATTVTCTASDDAAPANTAMCTFTVTVRDTTAPSISCPSQVDAECTSASGAIVTFSSSATDTCDPSPVVSCVPASGSQFPIGMTTVTCMATDAHTNSSSCQFTVSVGDVTIVSVLPDEGSEDGDDALKISGCNFTNVGDTTVLFGATSAAVVAVAPDRITVRTPPGTGTVDVTVTNSNGSGTLPQSFVYLDRVTAARLGDVNVCNGDRADVFRVNGSAGTGANREVVVAVGAPLTLAFSPSPAGPATGGRYVLWVWFGANASPRELVAQGTALGHVINPTPLHPNQNPQPFRCLRSAALPSIVCRGVTELNSPPTVPWSITRNQGLSHPLAFHLQGLVRDLGAGNSSGFSVTNAVLLRIQ